MSPHAFATGPHDFAPWPGMYEGAPPELLRFLEEPEFEKAEVTFCLWQGKQDRSWQQGTLELPPDTDDGAGFLLGTLFLDADEYLDWARDYYGKDIPERAVREIYANQTVSPQAALAINPDIDLTALGEELGLSLT